ncbi:type 1 fimbrial protein [Serratia sp. JSRIV002]|uniref:fimbrial protein n=1 Tax=Serratia sp. JSRIV002 TaxID=2831894 RepID=UPI001CBFBAF2|nr:fimbrial protein [Serratia sp. JSRIV002]UAN50819.1 type 1 fimbrial protein [Serratia sp. JSRIV002]
MKRKNLNILKSLFSVLSTLPICAIFISSVIFSQHAEAATCYPTEGVAPFQGILTLSGNITVGPDTPVGTVLYRADYTFQNIGSVLTCDADVTLQQYAQYSTTPLPIVPVAIGGFSGTVYESGLPGIGVFITGTNGFNEKLPRIERTDFFESGKPIVNSGAYRVWLVKTGPVTPGVINAANFPTVVTTKVAAGVAGLPLPLQYLQFSGSLNVVSTTCVTPDVNVDLGRFSAIDFTGANSATPWVDASVTLNSCPIFYGTYNMSNTSLRRSGNGVVTTSTSTSDPNALTIGLTPMNPVIDPLQGIMAVNSLTADPAAQGIGIQIGYGNSSGTPTPFNFSQVQTVIAPKDGTTTLRIPLAARYIKTNTQMVGGRADGKMTFTINYY